MRNLKVKIRKNDYFRVLLTETLPYEVPLLFSNVGFYRRAVTGKLEAFAATHGLKVFGDLKFTIPYQYRIRKNPVEYRTLSVMHPSQQLKVKGFYAKYGGIILAQCKKSEWSLRAPSAVASHYIPRVKARSKLATRDGRVETQTSAFEPLPKFASSYFTYSRYAFLYKFIESSEYHDLGKR